MSITRTDVVVEEGLGVKETNISPILTLCVEYPNSVLNVFRNVAPHGKFNDMFTVNNSNSLF